MNPRRPAPEDLKSRVESHAISGREATLNRVILKIIEKKGPLVLMMFGVNLKQSKAIGTSIPRQLIDDLKYWNYRS